MILFLINLFTIKNKQEIVLLSQLQITRLKKRN